MSETSSASPPKKHRLRDIVASRGTDRNSLSKVTMLIGVVVTSVVVLKMAFMGQMTEGIFGLYIGTLVGANSVNKAIAVVQNIKGQGDGGNPQSDPR